MKNVELESRRALNITFGWPVSDSSSNLVLHVTLESDEVLGSNKMSSGCLDGGLDELPEEHSKFIL